MAAAADPAYDLRAAIDVLMPGIVVQRNLLDAAAARYAAKGYVPLAAADVAGILSAANSLDLSTVTARYAPTTQANYTGLPAYPTLLPRFPDSNPSPFDGWTKYGDDQASPPP